MFVIGHVKDEMKYYHSLHGWVLIEHAELFYPDEMDSTKLPEFGYWATLWSLDLVQFARILYHCSQLKILNKKTIEILAEVTNSEPDEIMSIIDRAVNRHAEFCDRLAEKHEALE